MGDTIIIEDPKPASEPVVVVAPDTPKKTEKTVAEKTTVVETKED